MNPAQPDSRSKCLTPMLPSAVGKVSYCGVPLSMSDTCCSQAPNAIFLPPVQLTSSILGKMSTRDPGHLCASSDSESHKEGKLSLYTSVLHLCLSADLLSSSMQHSHHWSSTPPRALALFSREKLFVTACTSLAAAL